MKYWIVPFFLTGLIGSAGAKEPDYSSRLATESLWLFHVVEHIKIREDDENILYNFFRTSLLLNFYDVVLSEKIENPFREDISYRSDIKIKSTYDFSSPVEEGEDVQLRVEFKNKIANFIRDFIKKQQDATFPVPESPVLASATLVKVITDHSSAVVHACNPAAVEKYMAEVYARFQMSEADILRFSKNWVESAKTESKKIAGVSMQGCEIKFKNLNIDAEHTLVKKSYFITPGVASLYFFQSHMAAEAIEPTALILDGARVKGNLDVDSTSVVQILFALLGSMSAQREIGAFGNPLHIVGELQSVEFSDK